MNTDPAPGAAVWVTMGKIPMGARAVMPGDSPGVWWLSVCLLGQRLPQMYRPADFEPLADDSLAARLGLCPLCLGYGTTRSLDPPMYPWAVDELDHPCGMCQGSGRPALRVTREYRPGEVIGSVRVLPHQAVPPLRDTAQVCLACGQGLESHQVVGGSGLS